MPIEVHLVTPEREVWSGDAEMVIARGIEGEVGILGGHAPLLIRLAIGPLRIHGAGGERDVAVVDGGFLHVSSRDAVTRADVLAAHAELAAEIDVAAERRRLDELENQVGDDATGLAKGEIAKAMARIKLVG